MLQPKRRAGSAWLPNQVVYGIDCSDQDPTKWTAFGELAEQMETTAVSEGSKPAAKSGPPEK